MPKVVIIADDITGALDSSVCFAARGLRVLVGLSSEQLVPLTSLRADVVAITTGTREMPATPARDAIAQIAGELSGFEGIVFKKVDSRLKGPVAAELSALCARIDRPLFACPAIPAMGRVVSDGSLMGMGVAEPIVVQSVLGRPAHVPDAESDTDITSALPSDLTGTIFVGAAGLAKALAKRVADPDGPERSIKRLAAPSLWAVGSRDPITVTQVAQLAGVPVVKAPDGVVSALAPSRLAVVQMVPGPTPVSAQIAASNFAQHLCRIVRRDPPGSLFASGGETAMAILSKLGINVLEVGGEILPGIPIATACDGLPGLQIVTKSGGFGAPDTLARLASRLGGSGEESAIMDKQLI